MAREVRVMVFSILGIVVVTAALVLSAIEKNRIQVVVFVALLGVFIMGLVFDVKRIFRGQPAELSSLKNGIYVVRGRLEMGDDVAFWLAPLGSPKDFEYGKLCKLPKEASGDFGSYVKKMDDNTLVAYQFEER